MEQIVIPERAEFMPVEVADILGKSRQDINYLLNEGKIAWCLDYRGRRMVPRKALIEFATAEGMSIQSNA